MLLTLAWRNLWRNKRRSAIIIASVAVGVIALTLSDALSLGMMHQMLNNRIGAHVGHIQIHAPGFRANPSLTALLTDPDAIQTELASIPAIRQSSKRIVQFGLLSSSRSSAGVNIVGIEPERERRVSHIARSVVEGHYPDSSKGDILISRHLARKLEVELGDKVVAMASARDGTVGSEVFRVCGLFATLDAEFDKFHVYASLPTVGSMLGLTKEASQIVAIVDEVDSVGAYREAIQSQLGGVLDVASYRDLLPMLVFQLDSYEQLIWIFYLIVGLAMFFGIVNTMLMAVFERMHEFGVLMSLGMARSRMFALILLEAILLGLIGTLTGELLSWLVSIPWERYGLDLSVFSEALGSLGVGNKIYPFIAASTYLNSLIMVPAFAVLGALYPALKAIRLRPVEALRYV